MPTRIDKIKKIIKCNKGNESNGEIDKWRGVAREAVKGDRPQLQI